MGVTVRAILVAVVVLLGACKEPESHRDSTSPISHGKASPQTEETVIAKGDWEHISRAPIGWYQPEGAFWIKHRLVVVVGSSVQIWEPKTGEWNVIARIPQSDECEGCGYSEVVVWTGNRLLLWGGGFSYRAPNGKAYAGASVELNGDIEPLPKAPVPVRWWHDAVWTGEEMIIFGGGSDSHARRDGAAYDPSARTWRTLPRSPVGGYANSLIWTGEEMITWGGIRNDPDGTQGFPRGFIAKGAAYNPESNTWRTLATSTLDPRGWHTAIWTGEEMIVWGGVSRSRSDCYDCGYPEDTGAYDPEIDSWRVIDTGPLSGRVEHTAVWTGESMVVYGGSAPGGDLEKNDGAAYDLHSDNWAWLRDPPIKGRYRHAAIWTGREMIIWGGQGDRAFSDGAIFRPDKARR
jgi:hypothetical protein